LSRSPDPDLAALGADPRVHWVEDVLRFCDTDLNGHVNNSVFSVMCESGRVALFRDAFGATRPADTFFVIARLAIDFRTELHYPGTIRTGTWVKTLGRSSMGLAQVILSQGSLAATAEAVCVSMDSATRRPVPFDDATRAAAEALLRGE
jgi:acyl-CoA thioester hydrolase